MVEAPYRCPSCGSADPAAYIRCQRSGCPDGRDPRPDNRVATLERQIAELRAELTEKRRDRIADSEISGSYLCRAEAAEAENARLRALPLKDEVERELRKAHDETMGEAGKALLDKTVDGRIKANWLGGKANGLATALDILSRLRATPEAVSPSDPSVILAGIKQFGLASDGSDLRDLEAAIDRLRAGEQEGWRTIETAPKDGTRILLHGRVHLPSIDAGEESTVVAYWANINAGGWVWYGALSTIWTHWMPLPAAPSGQGGDRG